jgi:short-subunit dehydrogenase
MIHVHCEAVVRLSQAAVTAMAPRKKGFLINVASVAAFLTGPGAADYCATKAFIKSFSNCLQDDVRFHGIRVQALCPGYVHTGFHDAPTMKGYDISVIPGFLWLKSERVVRDSLRVIQRRRFGVTYIPSIRYKLICSLATLPVIVPVFKYFFGTRLKR